jgi:hypothetical protein
VHEGKWQSFYLKLIQTYGQPALDGGCGTGRLVLDYLAQGIDRDHHLKPPMASG